MSCVDVDLDVCVEARLTAFVSDLLIGFCESIWSSRKTNNKA